MKWKMFLVLCGLYLTVFSPHAQNPSPPHPDIFQEPILQLIALDSIKEIAELEQRLRDTCDKEPLIRQNNCQDIEIHWLKLSIMAHQQFDAALALESIRRAQELAIFHNNTSIKNRSAHWELRLSLDTVDTPDELFRSAHTFLQIPVQGDTLEQLLASHYINLLGMMDAPSSLLDSLRKRIHCPQGSSSPLNLQMICTQSTSELRNILFNPKTKGHPPRDLAIVWGELGRRFWLEKKYDDAAESWAIKRSIYNKHGSSKLDLPWGVELYYLGDFHLKSKRFSLASMYLGESVQWDGEHPWLPQNRRYQLYMKYVKALQASKRFDEASEILRKAVEIRKVMSNFGSGFEYPGER